MRRYRISTEILILILENLDPQTLWRACQAFSRIYNVVMEFQSLRYRFELALAAMKDGRAPRAHAPALARYQLLLSYKKDWPRLRWSQESRMQIPTPAQVGMSGGFVHRILTDGQQYCLELSELPSHRTGRPLTRTRHIRFSTPPIESVMVDPSQHLLVTTHLFRHIHLRDLWTFAKHRWAPALAYEFSTQSAGRVSHMSLQICGSKLGISMEFAAGQVKHLVMDWHTLHARWFEEGDILFLNETCMLVSAKYHGRPALNLYNITDVANVTNMRDYELPEVWANAAITFSSNSSPPSDAVANPDALFYPDPAARLLMLNVNLSGASNTRQSGHAKGPSVWLFANESYFRPPTSRRDPVRVSWKHWSQHCYIRNVQPSPFLRGPHVVGTKALYLDAEPVQLSRNEMGSRPATIPRLVLIDFKPFSDPAKAPAKTWTMGGKTTMVPYESTRDIPYTTIDNLNIDAVRMNEDNIVLIMELLQGMRNLSILTFGTPPAPRPRHK
ncbi:hypothetical protein BDN71DRAFT_1481884 [Pleurotus eryngii]|uniref:F-box domain-containing protein n=1 Tax=Pleurotus eryngii TaxID=5323 RepID=A0A9P5ZZF7_PLEER|nr:hypothetical protein BDN71DRAFT_1481884 [Pleurotus eryngii]